MYHTASAGPDQPNYFSDPDQLPGLLQQLVADLDDPAIAYLLGGHYYERTNHPRYRHFPAVFALRQGEVTNVEVGHDFVAFDTEFVRYPERGELHGPGPWADRFRATVPFAQLYQLCRQVLTPAEQAAEEVSYGPETVLYYNAAVYKQHPTPADINQAYAAVPSSGEHPLVAVLTAVAAGLADPDNHYLINTTAFESPDGPVLLGMLHVHAQTTRDLVIEADAFTCSVLLDPYDRQRWSTIQVNFAQVWQVLRSDSPQADLEEVEDAGGLLYHAPEVLSAYAQQGRLA
ncbi:hypothetical protein MUN82_22020 (plasmid) [Hymenobacter aerilatus]|uniref:Uncharacterized protein n=1 Tax=Hymenobacter aerilatus TaxID=2932251 RepID=A0A8T9T1M1_9BACT|nr:hypothetical protein [Hymenobacter aerilatus]UOR07717.1 hypothetical protein MUN82_22020 [Hymenobacter aerilatus]